MFGLFTQNHSNGKDNKIEGIFYDFSPLRVYEPYPQCIREGRVVNLGRKTPDETDSFILAARIEKGLKGCSRRLNIRIEKGGLQLRILVTNRFNQPESIGATDLRAIEVSNGFITASHTLKKGNGFREFSIGRTEKGTMKSKHFIEVFGGDHIFEFAISIFYFLGGIERINSRGNHNGGNA
jgi:hypothetical protein